MIRLVTIITIVRLAPGHDKITTNMIKKMGKENGGTTEYSSQNMVRRIYTWSSLHH